MAKQHRRGQHPGYRRGNFGMSVNTEVVAMTFSNTMKLVQRDNSSNNNPGTVGAVYSHKLAVLKTFAVDCYF